MFKEFALTLAGAVFISGVVALTLSPMMSSKLLKSNAKPTWMEERVEHTLGKVNRVYEYMLDLVMLNRKSMLAFAVVIFSTLPFLFNSLSSELTPNEDKGAFIAIGNAPSSVNVDYIQNAMQPYMKNVMETPEVSFGMSIAGAPTSNSSLNIITLKDWKERSRKQSAIMNEINEKQNQFQKCQYQHLTFLKLIQGTRRSSLYCIENCARL